MIKTLQKHGNSLALVIDKPLLDAMNIDPETLLDIQITENPLGLQIRPMRSVSKDQLKALLGKVNSKYGKMLQRLAK
jgi:antitoxin MazE